MGNYPAMLRKNQKIIYVSVYHNIYYHRGWNIPGFEKTKFSKARGQSPRTVFKLIRWSWSKRRKDQAKLLKNGRTRRSGLRQFSLKIT